MITVRIGRHQDLLPIDHITIKNSNILGFLKNSPSFPNQRWRPQQYEHKHATFTRPKYACTAGYSIKSHLSARARWRVLSYYTVLLVMVFSVENSAIVMINYKKNQWNTKLFQWNIFLATISPIYNVAIATVVFPLE